MENVPKKHQWLKPGVKVDYHSIIGGPVTKAGLTVREGGGPVVMGGTWVVWLDGQRGCVACEACTPPGAVEPIFPEGKFYSCTDPETLTCTEPEEALEQYLDLDLDPKMTVAELVASIRARPITVTAYRPMEVSGKQIEHWAESLLESLGEDFCEFCDPDESPLDAFPDDADQIMREAVKSIIERSNVWSCEPVGKVTLTPDQIEEVMRKYRPDWFDEREDEP